MSVLKCLPIKKQLLWGGQRINQRFNLESNENLAELWVLSTHHDGLTTLENGQTLKDYLQKNPHALGEGLTDCPILIKFIDANLDLSIQVHPNDEYAHLHLGDNGKNEMWIVLESDDLSSIYCGLNQEITKEQLEQSIHDQSIMEYLNAYDVKENDVFSIPAQTIHSIGAGNLICEIQQCSNATFRLYDFDRIDKNGQKRELHLKQALEVVDTKPGDYLVRSEWNSDSVKPLVKNDYFNTWLVRIDKDYNQPKQTTFEVMVALKGSGQINQQAFKEGDCFFIEAQTEVTIEGECEVLMVST